MEKILIIDDEPSILLMMKKMLEPSGYEVNIVSDGKQGLEAFKNDHVDLVITDIIMPEKEGLETILEMKKIKPDLKIIAISGGGRMVAEDYLNVALYFGASKVLQKPFKKNELIEAVAELLDN